MKILQVIDVLALVGGAQRSVLDAVVLLEQEGHDVFVLHGDEDADCGHIRSANYSDPALLNRIRDFDPDVVHVHAPVLPEPLEEAVVARPVVHSLHDFGFACSTGSKYFRDGTMCPRPHGPGCFVVGPLHGCLHRSDPRPAFARYRRIDRELPRLHAAAGVVVHSQFMYRYALANGFAADRVNLVPCFTRAFADPPPPSADRTIAFAGRIVAPKGLDLLIDALGSAANAWDGLLVAGDGWDRRRCERLARRRGIASRVEFLGHLDVQGVREVLCRARVVVVPSRWPEPFGIIGLEAMAVGRPVVATAVGGIPEWLDDGVTGILVPPGDAAALGEAIGSLLADPARAAELGAEGRQRAIERFSADRHMTALLAAYERALSAFPRHMSEAHAL